MKRTNQTALLVYLLSLSPLAHAYAGPGAGLSAIGSIAAFIGACLLVVIGFVWFPTKRLLNRKKANKADTAEQSNTAEDQAAAKETAEQADQ
jgi:membrane protease YdiL (CAAX protease family)